MLSKRGKVNQDFLEYKVYQKVLKLRNASCQETSDSAFACRTCHRDVLSPDQFAQD